MLCDNTSFRLQFGSHVSSVTSFYHLQLCVSFINQCRSSSSYWRLDPHIVDSVVLVHVSSTYQQAVTVYFEVPMTGSMRPPRGVSVEYGPYIFPKMSQQLKIFNLSTVCLATYYRCTDISLQPGSRSGWFPFLLLFLQGVIPAGIVTLR